MASIRDELASHIRKVGAPFLFVGSGISRRYLGTEDWAGLLKTFADKTTKVYDYYRVVADGDLPAIASAIAKEFNSIWWDGSAYAQSREDWASLAKDEESALKIEVANHLKGATALLPTTGPLATELDLLRTVVVDGIITTNYDTLLEELFPGYDVMIGQQDVLFCATQGVGEIYKVHGSVSRPDSLVLTTADYAEFEKRSSYLAAKLMTIFVEHPIVFLGYSLSDPNVVAILRSISECLTSDNIDQLRDRLIFIQWDADVTQPVMETTTIMFDNLTGQVKLNIPVRRVVVSDFGEIYCALASLQRRFPAPMLRKLKSHVYDLVLSDDPKEQLYVAEDLSTETPQADLDFVMGVGIKEKIGVLGTSGLTEGIFSSISSTTAATTTRT